MVVAGRAAKKVRAEQLPKPKEKQKARARATATGLEQAAEERLCNARAMSATGEENPRIEVFADQRFEDGSTKKAPPTK